MKLLFLMTGEIIERGNHTALLAIEGKYFQMWQKQIQLDEVQQKLSELEKNDENTCNIES